MLDERYKTMGNADPGTQSMYGYQKNNNSPIVDSLGQFIGTSSKKVDGGILYSDEVGNQRYVKMNDPIAVAPTVDNRDVAPWAYTDANGVRRTADGSEWGVAKSVPNTMSSAGVYNEASGANEKIDRQTQIFNTMQAALDAENKQLIADYNAQYEADRKNKIEEQKAAKATEGAIQYRLGQSGTSYGLAQTKQNDLKRNAELQALLSEKESLISKARRAYNSDNIKLYSTYINKIDELDEQYYQRQRQAKIDRINEYIDLSKEEREQSLAGATKAKTIADAISALPAGQTFVVDGVTYTGTKKEDIDAFWTSSALVSLAKELKVGETQTVDDPKYGKITVQGLRTDDPNIKQIQSADDSGNVTITSYDSATGKIVNQVSAGNIGKTKTQAANVTLNLTQGQSDALAAATNRLNNTKGKGQGGDTYWNTDVYIEERNKYAATPGADVKDFDFQYGWNLNPTSPEAKRLLIPTNQNEKAKSPQEIIAESIKNVNFGDK